MKFEIIGINDSRVQNFAPEIQHVIQSHTIFSGGKRHYEIVRPYLPSNHTWIQVVVPLSEVLKQYAAYDNVVVFASGDPLFYGIANIIIREIPHARVHVYPYFNSLQLLAHRLLMPYQDMHIVSLTGRPWDKLDEALIRGYEKIGILTDNKEHTPQTVASRMLEFGYDNYTMFVGQLLGNNQQEKVGSWRLEDVAHQKFAYPNNIILLRSYQKAKCFGIPESDFQLLNGRTKMITKMPVRLLSLSMLHLLDKKVFWDIGFCTGSVSIEAKLQFPHLKVVAFEKRNEARQLIEQNARFFGTPGIEIGMGNFTTLDLSTFPQPDAVFIGGHGGKMYEIIGKLADILPTNGVVVFNSVSTESEKLFVQSLSAHQFELKNAITIKVDNFNAINVMQAIKI